MMGFLDWWCRQSPYTKMFAAVTVISCIAYAIMFTMEILPDYLLIPYYFPVQDYFPMMLSTFDVTLITSTITAGVIISVYLISVVKIWDKKSYFRVLAFLYGGVIFYFFYLYLSAPADPPGIEEEIFWVIISGLSVTICGLVIKYICMLPCRSFCPDKKSLILSDNPYPVSGGSGTRQAQKVGRRMKKARDSLDPRSKFIPSNENSVNKYDESKGPEEKERVHGLQKR